MNHAIRSDDALRALWGDTAVGGEVPTPSAEEVRERGPDKLPANVQTSTVDLAEIVSKQNMDILRLGMKRMGASEDLLASLKNLDKLAENGGKFLAASLQTTHRMHFVQTAESFQLAKNILKIINADTEETDPAKKLSHEDRQAYYSLYLEMQDATGRAYALTLKGTEAMVRMLMAASKRGFRGKAAAPGFGAMKSEDSSGEEQNDQGPG